jgi:hypothetical protein
MLDKNGRPTHVVVLTHKDTKVKSFVGAAWENEWGFTLVLNPGTVLDWRMHEEYFLSVKPQKVRPATNGVEEKPSSG